MEVMLKEVKLRNMAAATGSTVNSRNTMAKGATSRY